MCKKALCLIFAFLFSIESMAAVVSDNDGSAFITKAEFDSLKNNFQSELDSYNTGIDNKIDNAIASYISGIKAEKTSVVTLPYASWEKVTMMNGIIDNEFKYPETNLIFTVMAGMKYTQDIADTETRYGYENYWGNTSIVYQCPSTIYSRRLLCDAGTEGTVYPENIQWVGLGLNFVDNITLNRILHVNYENSGPHDLDFYAGIGYLFGSAEPGFACGYATRIYPGYYPNLANVTSSLWHPRYYWSFYGQAGTIYRTPNMSDPKSTNNKYGYLREDQWLSSSNSVSINLNADSSGKTLAYNHILNYDTKNWPYFTDTDWINTLNYITDTSFTRKGLLSAASVNAKWSNLEWWNPYHNITGVEGADDVTPAELRYHTVADLYSVKSGDFLQGSTTNWDDPAKDDDTQMVTVGLIPRSYDSEHILQEEKVFSQIVDGGTVVASDKLNLINGFHLLAAKKNDVIEWKPEFIDTKSNGVSTDFELDLMLSLEPFGEEMNVSSNDKYIKLNNQTTAGAVSTTDKKATLKWTMPEDGIVYVKWKPTDSGVLGSVWEATLNLTNCSTYTRTV